MRAVQLAVFVMCIQFAGSIVTGTGLFSGQYWEGAVTPSGFGTASAQTVEEQEAISFDVLNFLFNLLAWGWIRMYFEPLYSNVAVVTNTINLLIIALNSISAVLIGIAFIQFLRNLTQPLTTG